MIKKNLSRLIKVFICCHFLTFNYLNAQTGTWTMVKTLAPHANMGVCLLMTDGTVICHNISGGGEGFGWDRLTPDIHGSYVNGTWDTIAPMNNDRLFFSSQVLPNGQVYVAGGEYGAGGPAGGEVYDPVANTWTLCGPIPNGWNVFDGNSELLYNGNVLEGPQEGANWSFDCLLWSPVTNQYTIAPSSLYNHDEAPWLKLHDSTVLFVGISTVNSNRYVPQSNTWINDGVLPGSLYDGLQEAGGAHLLPNGKAIFFGATPFNAIYTPSGNLNPGTWAAADSFPIIQGCYVGQSDASSAMMVNGHILLAVSPVNACVGAFQPPCYFLEYDYLTNTFTQVTAPIPGMGGDSIPIPSYQTQMLDLPDGSVLLSISQDSALSNTYYVYTPGSAPIPQGKPTINNITKINCNDYSITGKLFNGISEGACYGDDWQMATNYPIVRLTSGTSVYYAKTSNWNRVAAVQTDSLEDTTYFTVSPLPGGTYSLVVIANGFASNPRTITLPGILNVSANATANVLCHGGNNGSAKATASGGVPSYTYLWSGGGGTNATATGLSAGTYTVTVTDSCGNSAFNTVYISQPAALLITVDSTDSWANPCNGKAIVTASGGKAPYTYLWSPGGQTTDTVKGLCSGNYCCKVKDKNGCLDSVCVNVITGIENIEAGTGNITLYPNPNNGQFTIESLVVSGKSSVEIYNVFGQTIYYIPFSIQHSIFNINLSGQPSGIYFYRVIDENSSLLGEGKVIINK